MNDNIFVKWNDKWPEPSESEANIIFDTDIGPDYDDTGVAVMLHNYANKGKVNILAMLCSTSAPYGAAYLNLLNIYYGRRDIPEGDRGTVLSSPFPTDLKEKYIKKFHANGVSIRQISRLCGETEGIVEKYLR